MSKESNVVQFYTLCNKLKDTIRTGWKDWNVKRNRLESVAEHIYGVQMLALAMYSEFQYSVDIRKVIIMIAVHELEEIFIGDLTQFQISKDEKAELGHKAIKQLLTGLSIRDEIESIILEFDERKTPEAFFAYQCDKLECDIQSKLYDEEECVDLKNQDNNLTFKNSDVQRLLKSEKKFSNMWLQYGQEHYPYDDNFISISNYVKKNKIHL